MVKHGNLSQIDRNEHTQKTIEKQLLKKKHRAFTARVSSEQLPPWDNH